MVDNPLAAAYPAIGNQVATLLLDRGRDAYRFTGRRLCVGWLDVCFSARRFPVKVLETQIRAHRLVGNEYVTQAVSTVSGLTAREQLPVAGGARYRVEVLLSRGADQQGTAATSGCFYDLDIACDEVASLDIDLAVPGQVVGN